jgi:addiction module HigA family antidote
VQRVNIGFDPDEIDPMANLLPAGIGRACRRNYRLPLRRKSMKSKVLANIPPGEILQEDFLKPLGLSQYRLAKDICVPARRINEIVKGERAITADTALRLGRYFKMSAQFWLNLQSHYDLEVEEVRLGRRLEREVKVAAA